MSRLAKGQGRTVRAQKATRTHDRTTALESSSRRGRLVSRRLAKQQSALPRNAGQSSAGDSQAARPWGSASGEVLQKPEWSVTGVREHRKRRNAKPEAEIGGRPLRRVSGNRVSETENTACGGAGAVLGAEHPEQVPGLMGDAG